MIQTVFYLILGIIVFDFIFERLLDYLNTTRWGEQLPDKLKGIYDDEEYKKSQAYKKANHKFGMVTSSFSFLIIFLMLFFKGFALVNGWALGFTGNIILSSLIFFAILGLASDILTTPFSVYDTFVIETRFGFNKTTPKTFILDKIKGLVLAVILGGGLLALIIFIWSITGNFFWLGAWGLVTIITLFMTMFYSNRSAF
jgi:STE24 endopeptidase